MTESVQSSEFDEPADVATASPGAEAHTGAAARTGAEARTGAGALDLVPLAGSERPAVHGLAAAATSLPRDQRVEATLVLRRANELDAGAVSSAGVEPSAFAERYGAAPADVELVTATLRGLGLDIVEVDAASRRVRVSGTVAAVERVFGTTLHGVVEAVPAVGASPAAGAVPAVGAAPAGEPSVEGATPNGAASAGGQADGSGVQADGVQADGGGEQAAGGQADGGGVQADGAGDVAQNRRRSGGLSIPASLDGIVTAVLGLDDRPQARAQFRVAQAHAATVSYTPVQLGEIYDFPAETSGAGQTVAIVELGGGFSEADLDAYFGGLSLEVPSVRAVGVDGASNAPGRDAQGADGEVLLDIEVVGALAPKANILVYFAPNTDAGFLDAVATAAHATPTPAAISISWGQSEDQWTTQARTALDDALLDAAALGVTVTAAAGDNGSSDGETDGQNHADFPASSPHALACGGTSLRATGTSVTSETVWNDGSGKGATGGGVSDVFALPQWQKAAGVPAPSGRAGGRGVPDVAANADPQTGYEVLVDGTRAVYGGTSAVAPLWAALVARLVESLGSPLGLLQPALYAASAAPGLRDVTVGDNGAFQARSGWDACTGLGVPRGTALLEALRAGGAGGSAGGGGAGAGGAAGGGAAGGGAAHATGAPADLADELRSIRAIGEDR